MVAASNEPRTYPEGVTSWIDIEPTDVEAAMAFYGGLLGWTFSHAEPGADTAGYRVARLGGLDAAGIGSRPDSATPVEGPASWNTYIAVDDADIVAAQVRAAGGQVVDGPSVAGDAGRSASCIDPAGVAFRLWEAHLRLGAQAVNTPGGWNFSDLHAVDPPVSAAFYSEVFGWAVDDLGFATMLRLPGYGDHLQATSDPEIYTRQAGVAPPGFPDAIGWLAPVSPGEAPHWHVAFTVADRDWTVAEAQRLGGEILGRDDTDWTRDALIRDPQGGLFTASQFAPSSG